MKKNTIIFSVIAAASVLLFAVILSGCSEEPKSGTDKPAAAQQAPAQSEPVRQAVEPAPPLTEPPMDQIKAQSVKTAPPIAKASQNTGGKPAVVVGGKSPAQGGKQAPKAVPSFVKQPKPKE